MKNELDQMVTRLERAERLMRLSLAFSALALVGLGVVCTLRTTGAYSAANFTTVTAPFRVVDENGAVLVEIVQRGGDPSLLLRNRDGKVIASMTGMKNHGGIAVFAADGTAAVNVMANPPGGRIGLWNTQKVQLTADLQSTDNGGRLRLWGVGGAAAPTTVTIPEATK